MLIAESGFANRYHVFGKVLYMKFEGKWDKQKEGRSLKYHNCGRLLKQLQLSKRFSLHLQLSLFKVINLSAL